MRALLGSTLRGLAAAVGSIVALALAAASAHAADPIKIGFGMALTGGLAPNGKSALLAMQIWEEEINAKGGLMGRPVKLVYYDDQSNPSTVPGLYTKLMDVDKVDLVIGGYATNMLAPAMPVVMQRKKTFIGLFGLGVNTQFKYDRYFAMIPTGQNPKVAMSKGFFDVVMGLNPKPKKIAIVAADAEFSQNAADGARANAKQLGLEIVYDKSYPPSTTDFAPIVRAIQATNPDIVYVGSYPPDSVGMVQSANELGLKAQVFGGAMVGLQATVFKTKLGPALNGIINYDFWLPAGQLDTPAARSFLTKYQERAAKEGVDPIGYYMGPFAYAYIDLLGQAIEGTKSLDDAKLAQYLHANSFKTMVGDVKFGPDGEWANDQLLFVQYRGIKGNDAAQFKSTDVQPVLAPPAFRQGTAVNYDDARK